jgi:hypothetical protein
VCLVGASWVSQHILRAHPNAKLKVIAIWLPMLGGDSRSSWSSRILDDPRVTSLWDGDRLAGNWFADEHTGGLSTPGSIVWDAYLAYGADARWQQSPTDPIVAGSDIIANTDGLEKQFVPLLR